MLRQVFWQLLQPGQACALCWGAAVFAEHELSLRHLAIRSRSAEKEHSSRSDRRCCPPEFNFIAGLCVATCTCKRRAGLKVQIQKVALLATVVAKGNRNNAHVGAGFGASGRDVCGWQVVLFAALFL